MACRSASCRSPASREAVRQLKAGAAGHRLLPRGGAGGGRGVRRRCDAAPLSPERSPRCGVSTGVAEYDVSADGRKLLYRTGGGAGGRGGGAATAVNLFLVDADRTPPAAGQGRLDVSLRMYLEPREEFEQIFAEGWRNQRDYLYVTNMHGANWTRMKEMYGSSCRT